MKKAVFVITAFLMLCVLAVSASEREINLSALAVHVPDREPVEFTSKSTWIEIIIHQFLYPNQFNAKVVLSKERNMQIIATGVDNKTFKLTYDTIQLSAKQAAKFRKYVTDFFVTHKKSVCKSRIETDIFQSVTGPNLTVVFHKSDAPIYHDERYNIIYQKYTGSHEQTFTHSFIDFFNLVNGDAYFRNEH